jgi:hypothetical protein
MPTYSQERQEESAGGGSFSNYDSKSHREHL